jgi:uncharacterized protein YkwD
MPNVVLRRRALLVRGLRIAVPQVTILAVLAGSLALPAAGAGYSRSALDGAEQAVIAGVNKYRAEVGLRRLLLDERIGLVARERSASMAREGYFAHSAPDGTDAGDLMDLAGIKRYAWGEAIGWNTRATLDESVAWMLQWWRNSGPHYGLIVSAKYNYIGVGVVQKGSRIIYTIVFARAPDRTQPKVRLLGVSHATGGTEGASSAGNVTVSWKGSDVPLAALTAGLDGFRVQHRVGKDPWSPITRWTTERSMSLALGPGEHHFRVRSRDKARNMSAWTEPAAIVVP